MASGQDERQKHRTNIPREFQLLGVRHPAQARQFCGQLPILRDEALIFVIEEEAD
jgi:hypothetical protein